MAISRKGQECSSESWYMIELFWCVASCKFKLFPPWAVFFRASWFLCSVGERMCAGVDLIHEEGSSCLPGSDGVGGLICQADLRSS